MICNLEEDADQVLRYMASNGLVANAKKTAFLILNGKNADREISVKIGNDTVTRSNSACLLGINFQDNFQWKTQISGLLSALNSRLYIIRRLQSHLNKKSILRVVDGIFTSKLRYGLQLYGKARTKDSDPECSDFKAIQLVQNKLLRSLNGTKIKDMVSTSSLLQKFGMLSANQMNVQLKLVEVWKAMNVQDYPLKIERQSVQQNGVSTRADSTGKPIGIGKSLLTQKSCISNAIHLWNLAPVSVTGSLSLYQAKAEIKKYVRQLPV